VAHMAQVDVGPDKQNLKLHPGESHTFHTPDGLSGTRYWAKMRCDAQGDKCEIGESGGPGEHCNNTMGCAPPVDTKFEATFGADGGVDWVDVSLVDGWTLPFTFNMSKNCTPGEGAREITQHIDCSQLVMDECPRAEDVGKANRGAVDLRVKHPGTGNTVGCFSPCSALTFSNWQNPLAKYSPAHELARDYCCPTPPESPRECRAGPVNGTEFVRTVHRNCPGVYGYAYDDGMGLLLCPKDTLYEMTFFCPGGPGGAAGRGEGPQDADARSPPLEPLDGGSERARAERSAAELSSAGPANATTTAPSAETTTAHAASKASSSDSKSPAPLAPADRAARAGDEANATGASEVPELRHQCDRAHSRDFQNSSKAERAWCCKHVGKGCTAPDWKGLIVRSVSGVAVANASAGGGAAALSSVAAVVMVAALALAMFARVRALGGSRPQHGSMQESQRFLVKQEDHADDIERSLTLR